ncbi:hypothetical protein [Streptomyces echinatus]
MSAGLFGVKKDSDFTDPAAAAPSPHTRDTDGLADLVGAVRQHRPRPVRA